MEGVSGKIWDMRPFGEICDRHGKGLPITADLARAELEFLKSLKEETDE